MPDVLIPLVPVTRGADRYLAVERATGNIVAELTREEHDAVRDRGVPAGVDPDAWHAGDVVLLGGVPDYGNGTNGTLRAGDVCEYEDRFEVGAPGPLGLQRVRIPKNKVSVQRTARGLSLGKLDADAWPAALGLREIRDGHLVTDGSGLTTPLRFGALNNVAQRGERHSPTLYSAQVNQVNAASSATFAVGVGVGSPIPDDRALFCYLGFIDAIAGAQSLTSLAYGGQSLTVITGTVDTSTLAGTNDWGHLFAYMVSPPIGEANLTATWSETIDVQLYINTVWSDVDQGVPAANGTNVEQTSATPSLDITSRTGDVTMDGILFVGTASTEASDEIPIIVTNPGAGGVGLGSAYQAGAATVTHSYQNINSGFPCLMIGFSIQNSNQAVLAQTLGDAALAADAALAIAADLAQSLADATLSSAAVLEIAAAVERTLDDATAEVLGSLAIVADLAATLEAATLSADASTGAPITADLDVTLEDVTLSADATVPQEESEASTGGVGGQIRRRRRSRKPAFTVIEPRVQPLPEIHARLEVTLEDCRLQAHATVTDTPKSIRRRNTLAVLMAG